MRVGVPGNTSVCFHCPFRIRRLISPPTPESVLSYWRTARTQSTAAAVVQDVEHNVNQPEESQRPYKRSKKGLRRRWKPPPVAELGVSSLGKPAEVLVLGHRDRHVLISATDEAERFKASEPRILEALHAENLPLSSESVRQSLDQIRLPYQTSSKAVTAKERVELTKKLMDGFTQEQLQSYCLEGDGSNLAEFAGMLAIDGNTQRRTVGPTKKTENPNDGTTAPKVLPRLRKALLVKYIVKQKWALSSFEDDQTKQVVSVSPKKLDYLLKLKHKSLETYATELKVALEASKDGKSIIVTGKYLHVRAAHSHIQNLIEKMEILRIRSVTAGRSLKSLATPTFLDQISRVHNVQLDWASSQDEAIRNEEDWLMVCSDKTVDPQNAFRAERAVLLYERDMQPTAQKRPLQVKISMWLSHQRVEPALITHEAPLASGMVSQQHAWSRWTIPQIPRHVQFTRSEPGPGDKDQDATTIASSSSGVPRSDAQYMSVGVGPVTSPHEAKQYSTSVNKEGSIISRFLEGSNDVFFFGVYLKRQREIRALLDSKKVQEEIFVELGKILFPQDEVRIENACLERSTIKRTDVLSMKNVASTLTSLDIPSIPNFLRSLSPFDETESIGDDKEKEPFYQAYRLRYIPVPSELPHRFAYPTIEIDISRKSGSDSTVTNQITGAWAILVEQRHKLLTPLFALDFEFVRRLKRQLLPKRAAAKDGDTGETTWLEAFGEQISTSDPEQFPPFLKPTLPEYSVKSIRSQYRDMAKKHAPKDIEYLLESCNLVHSTAFRLKPLCLEHLNIENMTANKSRELLRIAPQPLFDQNIRQAIMPALVERAFRVGAHISNPRICTRLDEPDPLATETAPDKAVSSAADRESA